MHYYKFNIGDYASHTRHLSPLEDIAYRRMLDVAYSSEQPLTKDVRQLSRLINMREYQQEIKDVLEEFWVEVEEGWISNRVLKEIEDTGGKSEKAKESANIRWENFRKAKAMQEECERNANASEDCANEPKNDATQDPRPKTQDIKKQKPLCALVSLGVAENYAKDWIEVRKAKRAPITETVLTDLQREAEKAGLTVGEAVMICARKSWQGFNAAWNWQDAIPDKGLLNGEKKPFDMAEYMKSHL